MATVVLQPEERENAVVVLAKAIGFLALVEGFYWVVQNPLKERLEPSVKAALAPILGEYTSYWVVSALAFAAFNLLLTALVMRIFEHKSFSGIGLQNSLQGHDNFWKGIFVGFVPGMVLTFVLGAAGIWDTSSFPSFVSFAGLLLSGIATILALSGYSLQKLLDRFGPAPAIIIVWLVFNADYIVLRSQKGDWGALHGIPIVVLVKSVLGISVLAFAYMRTRSLWLPAGVYLGMMAAPTGGGTGIVLARWNYHLEVSNAGLYSLNVGLPACAITVIVGLLLAWFLSGAKAAPSRLSPWFYTGAWSLGSGLVLAVSIGRVREVILNPGTQLEPLGLVLIAVVACSSAVFLVLIYKMWAALQDGVETTTPGRAVGFLFIPLFNLFWLFKAVGGFPVAYNEYVQRHSLPLPKLASGLFYAYVLASLLAWVPLFGVFAAALAWVLGILVISQACNAVNALPQKNMTAVTPPPLAAKA